MLTIQDIQVGDSATFSKTISESDVYQFAGITGDFNPAHVDEAYAQGTFFKGRIAHGMLCGGLISAVLGTKLPGPGAIYIEQTLKFMAPVRFGDTITAKVEALEISPKENRIRFRTTCSNQEGKIVVDGEALISPFKERKKK